MLQHSGQERSPKILLSESKLILESDEVEDIVSKNRNLSTVESEQRTCATLVQSVRSDLMWKLNSPQIPHAIQNLVSTWNRNSRI